MDGMIRITSERLPDGAWSSKVMLILDGVNVCRIFKDANKDISEVSASSFLVNFLIQHSKLSREGASVDIRLFDAGNDEDSTLVPKSVVFVVEQKVVL